MGPIFDMLLFVSAAINWHVDCLYSKDCCVWILLSSSPYWAIWRRTYENLIVKCTTNAADQNPPLIHRTYKIYSMNIINIPILIRIWRRSHGLYCRLLIVDSLGGRLYFLFVYPLFVSVNCIFDMCGASILMLVAFNCTQINHFYPIEWMVQLRLFRHY